jgi:hypothetical protein
MKQAAIDAKYYHLLSVLLSLTAHQHEEDVEIRDCHS